MFILLTEQNKKSLYYEYRIRLLSVFIFFMSALFVISAGFLFPSFIVDSTEKKQFEKENDTLIKLIEEKNSKGLLAKLADIQSMTTIVKPDDTKIVSAIETVLNHRQSGVSITRIDYVKGDKLNPESQSSLVFQGVADFRSDLITFSKDLQKQPMFMSVNIPVSNLAKETNVKFSLTVLGKF